MYLRFSQAAEDGITVVIGFAPGNVALGRPAASR